MLLLAYLGHLRRRFQEEAGNATSRKRWKTAVSRPRSQIGHLRICENLPQVGELMFFDPRNLPQIGKIAKLGWKPSSDGGNRDTAIGSQRHFGDDEPHINRESSNKETDCRRSLRPEARVQKPEPRQMANAANSWEKQKGMTEAMPWNETLPSFVSRASARRPSGPARNQARPAYRGRKSKRGQ